MMKKIIPFIISSLVFIVPSSAIAAICTTYDEPVVASKSDFADTISGTLGIFYTKRRYLVFPTLGCYDIHPLYSLESIKFYINSRKNEISYLTAAVSKIYPYRMHNVPSISLDLYRNGGVESGVWIRAVENEAAYVSNSKIAGSEFAILPRKYDTEKNNVPPFDMENLDHFTDFDFRTSPEFVSKWHALLSDAPNPPDINSIYEVFSNTRNNIVNVVSNMEELALQSDYTITTKIYLIKFKSNGSVVLNREILDIKSKDCIYLNYQLDGYSPVPKRPGSSTDFLVLRTKAGAVC